MNPSGGAPAHLLAAATRFLAASWFSGVISSRRDSCSKGVRRSCATAAAHRIGPMGPAHDPLIIDEPLMDGATAAAEAERGRRNGDAGPARKEDPPKDVPGETEDAGEDGAGLRACEGEPRSPETERRARAGLGLSPALSERSASSGALLSFSADDGVTERGLPTAAAAAALSEPRDAADEVEAPERVASRLCPRARGVDTSISSTERLRGFAWALSLLLLMAAGTGTGAASTGSGAAAGADSRDTDTESGGEAWLGAAAGGGGEGADGVAIGDGAVAGRDLGVLAPSFDAGADSGAAALLADFLGAAELAAPTGEEEKGCLGEAAPPPAERGDPTLRGDPPVLRGDARLPAEGFRCSFAPPGLRCCFCCCCAARVRGVAAARRIAAVGAPVALGDAFPALRGLARPGLDPCLRSDPAPALAEAPCRGEAKLPAPGDADEGDRRVVLELARGTFRAPAATAAALEERCRCGEVPPAPVKAGSAACAAASFAAIAATVSETPATGAVSISLGAARGRAGTDTDRAGAATAASDSFPPALLLPLPRSNCRRTCADGPGDDGRGGDCGWSLQSHAGTASPGLRGAAAAVGD